jgi:hypothetical protein
MPNRHFQTSIQTPNSCDKTLGGRNLPAARGIVAQTELEVAQADTIRLQLFKIGAMVRVTVRRVWVALSEAYPFREVFVRAWEYLRGLAAGAPAAAPTS